VYTILLNYYVQFNKNYNVPKLSIYIKANVRLFKQSYTIHLTTTKFWEVVEYTSTKVSGMLQFAFESGRCITSIFRFKMVGKHF